MEAFTCLLGDTRDFCYGTERCAKLAKTSKTVHYSIWSKAWRKVTVRESIFNPADELWPPPVKNQGRGSCNSACQEAARRESLQLEPDVLVGFASKQAAWWPSTSRNWRM